MMGGLVSMVHAGANMPALLPLPAQVQVGEGAFVLDSAGAVQVAKPLSASPAANMFRELVKPWSTAGEHAAFVISEPAADRSFGPEEYRLVITRKRVELIASEPGGLFYGVQTLRQLVDGSDGKTLPCLEIQDRPRFAWRGLMQDCSRTFLPIDYLKKYIDVLSHYKLNVLHLHLTDDQGWRVEIRKHPELTEIGGKFDSRFPGEVSGVYTQAEMRSLVQYAAERNVTLVPEIEMPSHCLGLLAAHPELSCRGEKYVIAPFTVMMGGGENTSNVPVPYGVMCVGNDKLLDLIEDVLAEVIEVFPSGYIHIGGDECPKDFWKSCPKCQERMRKEGLKDEHELQSWFIKRVEKMVVSRGRKLIGWDEILEGGLAPQAAVMSWRGMEGGIAAARQGHDVVVCPTSHCYFDYPYSVTPPAKTYAFEPVAPELTVDEARHVLGVQACMWTHIARKPGAIDAMIFPRALALAEVAWSPARVRNWEDFDIRMQQQYPRLKRMNTAYFVPAGPGVPNLTVGLDGSLWHVDEGYRIRVRRGSGWQDFAGKARQVAVGPKGQIWAVGVDAVAGGYPLCEHDGKEFKPISEGAAGTQIAAAPDGSLWAINDMGAVWRYAERKWQSCPGLARQVCVGMDGTVWIVGLDSEGDSYPVLKWNGKGWDAVGKTGHKIAIGPDGQPLFLASGTVLFKRGESQGTGDLVDCVTDVAGVQWGILQTTSGRFEVARFVEGSWRLEE